MADSYVCSGAMMKCTMGTSPARLTVLPSRTVFLTGQPMANISDHLTKVNLAPFGLCRSLGFPATAAATAANHGSLTPRPCMHNTPFPWMGGKNDYLIQGQPALLKNSSKCQCLWGGTISIEDDGQHGEGTQWVQKMPKETLSTKTTDKESLSDSVSRMLIMSHASVMIFKSDVAKATDEATGKVCAILGDITKQVIKMTKDVLVDSSKKICDSVEKVAESAMDVVHTLGKSVLEDVTNLSIEIPQALTDETLLEIMEESTNGINRNAASLLIRNMYQGAISGGNGEVMQALSKHLSPNKKDRSKELFRQYIVSHLPLMCKIGSLVETINSLNSICSGDYIPDDFHAIPQTIDYIVSRTGKDGEVFVDNLSNLRNQLSDLPLEKYLEIKSFVKSSSISEKEPIFATGKEYLQSLNDSVGNLIITMSYNISSL